MGTTVRRRERLFTVSEYHHLACDGILNGDDRVELINGKIYLMSPIGSRHAECVRRLTEYLFSQVFPQARVSIQSQTSPSWCPSTSTTRVIREQTNFCW